MSCPYMQEFPTDYVLEESDQSSNHENDQNSHVNNSNKQNNNNHNSPPNKSNQYSESTIFTPKTNSRNQDINTKLRNAEPCYYHDYLQLNKILNANYPRSAEFDPNGIGAHDEHLFITIHQGYELWFKQILFELNSCIDMFANKMYLDDTCLLTIVSRFSRINTILKLLIEQFTILDTMTPLDFLDFRKYLSPASGFQSVQFRILENRLGLNKLKRMKYNKKNYYEVLTDEHSKLVLSEENKLSLFDAIEQWLQRCPYLVTHDWSFWESYKNSVNQYMKDGKLIQPNLKLANETYNALNETFNCVLDENIYNEFQKSGKIRISHQATKAALMIMLYRNEPILQMPFQIIDSVMEMENLLTKWRNSHALMVHRMLGSKMGTGGSSGFHYLRTASIHHKVFTDFFNLSTYMIPRSYLSALPNSIRLFMHFPIKTKGSSLQLLHSSQSAPQTPYQHMKNNNDNNDIINTNNNNGNDIDTCITNGISDMNISNNNVLLSSNNLQDTTHETKFISKPGTNNLSLGYDMLDVD